MCLMYVAIEVKDFIMIWWRKLMNAPLRTVLERGASSIWKLQHKGGEQLVLLENVQLSVSIFRLFPVIA